MEIIRILISIVLVSLPITVWAYMFAYFDGTSFHFKKFILGGLAGALGVLPIAYSAEIFEYFHVASFLSVFANGGGAWAFVSAYVSSFGIPITLLLIGLVCVYPTDIWRMRGVLLKVVGTGMILVGIGATILAFLPDFGTGALTIQGAVFSTFTSIVIVYIFIASLEEALKHLSTYATITPKTTLGSDIILFSIYTALGFVFLENMLYVTGIASTHGIVSGNYIGTLISRSIISLLLHVFAALILARGFAKYMAHSNLAHGTQLFSAFVLSTIVHATFNIALTYEKMWIVFVYGLVIYFFMTKVFYDERKSNTPLSS